MPSTSAPTKVKKINSQWWLYGADLYSGPLYRPICNFDTWREALDAALKLARSYA